MKLIILVVSIGLLSLAAAAQDVKVPNAPGFNGIVLAGGVVKNAPYSGEAVTESTQVLADGNRITRRSVSRQYRDSDGRTRREDMKSQLGVPGAVVDVPQSIVITDPVSGVRYDLDTKNNTARASNYLRLAMPSIGLAKPLIQPMPAVKASPDGVIVKRGFGDAAARAADQAARDQAKQAREAERVRMAEARMVSAEQRHAELKPAPGTNDSRSRTEDLGLQNVEGVQAQGSRTTTVIPAGTIGNERDIEVVYERWYSPELKLTVMSRRSDPRTGEQVYRLTNINRSDPPANLFVPPPDFTLIDHTDHKVPGTPKISTTNRRPTLQSRKAGTN